MGCTPEEQAQYEAFFGDHKQSFEGLKIRNDGKALNFYFIDELSEFTRDDMQTLQARANMVLPDQFATIDNPGGAFPVIRTVDLSQDGRRGGKTLGALELEKQAAVERFTDEWLKVQLRVKNEVGEYLPLSANGRGSIPHFKGCAVPTWDVVDTLERECKNVASTTSMSYEHAANVLVNAMQANVQCLPWRDRIKQAQKELTLCAQSAKENAIFSGRISARQARRSAQDVKFTKQIKNNFNVKKRK